MKYIIFISIIFLISTKNTICNKLEPLEITKLVFDENGFDNSQVLPFCCDLHLHNFKDSSFGQTLPKNAVRNYELIFKDDSSALVSVGIRVDVSAFDLYVFFRKIDDWHIETIRTLAGIELINQIIYEYQNLQVDSAKSKLMAQGYDNLELFIKRLKLSISSDSEIEKYFRENISSFNKIIEYIETHNYDNPEERISQINNDVIIKELLKDILIDKIVDAEEGEFVAGFMIGGIIDNSVGYFYQPDKTKLPKISKSLYILIKPLGNGWYMYKTT
jgi:hypothetical protein